jgi:hypothetical protein
MLTYPERRRNAMLRYISHQDNFIQNMAETKGNICTLIISHAITL